MMSFDSRRAESAALAFAVTLASGVVLSVRASAQPAPLPIDDAFAIKTFQIYDGGPAVSPDSKWAASVVCDPAARAKDKAGRMTDLVASRGAAMYSWGCDIVLNRLDGSASRRVTNGEGNNWAPSWSPGGESLAFYSDRDGKTRLWLWEARSGKTRRVGDAVVRVGIGSQRPLWLPGGSEVLVTLHPEGMSEDELDVGVPGQKHDARPETDAVAGSTVKVYRSGAAAEKDQSAAGRGAALVQRYIADIARVAVATGRATTIVRRANEVRLLPSPDGTRILYAALKPGGSGLVAPMDVVVADLATGARRVLVENNPSALEAAPSWSPDGRRIAFFIASEAASGSLQTGGSTDVRGALAIVPAEGGAVEKFAPSEAIPGFDADNSPPRWSADGKAIYAVGDERVWRATVADGKVAPLTAPLGARITTIVPAHDGTAWEPAPGAIAVTASDPKTLRSSFRVIARDGGVTTRVDEQKRYVMPYDRVRATPDGRAVIYDAESSAAPEDLWITTSGLSVPVRLTHLNPQVEKYPSGESRIIEFHGADGDALRAALFLPAGYESGKRYPVIALVYASGMGSQSVNSFGIDHYGEYNYQILTTRGYAILAPDIPVHTGTPMRDLMKAVMPAIDRVIELGIADPDRLGVTGQSNGGYSTLALICQTTRFKAALMNSGFGDLVGFYGSMNKNDGSGGWHPWLEKLGGAMGAPPWEAPQRYVENSPIFYLDRIQTPLMMQAGGDDDGIVEFSDEVYVGLKRLNKDVVYLRYRDESHLLERHANKLDYWNRVLPFLDAHLKPAS
jgi:dipeptidyl aminopeptidase/acylaminoacyl peptidase